MADAQIAAIVDELRARGKLAADAPLPEPAETVSRWILGLQAFGGWLAALFLLLFLGVGASALIRTPTGWLIAGLLLTLAAGTGLRRSTATGSRGVFLSQFYFAVSLAGQGAVMIGLLDGRHGNSTMAWLTVAAFEAIVFAAVPWPTHRLIAAYAVLAALLGAVADFKLDSPAALPLIVVYWALACALYLAEDRWRAQRNAPLIDIAAAALALHVAQFAAVALIGGIGLRHRVGEPGAVWLLAVISGPAIGLALREVWRGALAVAAALLFASLLVATWRTPGIHIGLAMLVFGFGGGRRWLMWLGGSLAVAAIGHFYYDLQLDLLDKSGLLLLGGSLLLALRQLLAARPVAGGHAMNAKALILAGIGWVAIALGWMVADNEAILAHGRIVRLELAPVDPRSLMQGDYMALNYTLHNQLRGDAARADGYAILALDERSVGRLLRVQPATSPLAPGEVALRYRVRGRGVRVASNAFFFQEGEEPRYRAAKFGEFRVSDAGEPRLVALLDAGLVKLGDNRY